MNSTQTRSRNKYDVYKWVEKVIDSCKTEAQLITADRLVSLFWDMYKDDYLHGALSALSNFKWDEVLPTPAEGQMILEN